MPTVKRQNSICKKKGALGKWQGATGKIYKREARDVKEVARCKARHRVRQGKTKKSKAGQGVSRIYCVQVKEARGSGHKTGRCMARHGISQVSCVCKSGARGK